MPHHQSLHLFNSCYYSYFSGPVSWNFDHLCFCSQQWAQSCIWSGPCGNCENVGLLPCLPGVYSFYSPHWVHPPTHAGTTFPVPSFLLFSQLLAFLVSFSCSISCLLPLRHPQQASRVSPLLLVNVVESRGHSLPPWEPQKDLKWPWFHFQDWEAIAQTFFCLSKSLALWKVCTAARKTKSN